MNDVNYIVTPVVEHLENVKAEIALLSPEELEQALNTITGFFKPESVQPPHTKHHE